MIKTRTRLFTLVAFLGLPVTGRLYAACGTSAWATRGHDGQRTYTSDGCISGPLTRVVRIAPSAELPADGIPRAVVLDSQGQIFANMDVFSYCPAPDPQGHCVAIQFDASGRQLGRTCMNFADMNLWHTPSLSPDDHFLWYNDDVGDLLDARPGNLPDAARFIGWETWGDSVLDGNRIYSFDHHSNPDFGLGQNQGITYPHVYAIGYANGASSWNATFAGLDSSQIDFNFTGSLALDNSTVIVTRTAGSPAQLTDAILAYDEATGQPKWSAAGVAASPQYALTTGNSLLYGVEVDSGGVWRLVARHQSDGSIALTADLRGTAALHSTSPSFPSGHLVLADGKIIVPVLAGSSPFLVAYDALSLQELWRVPGGAEELAAAAGSHTLVTVAAGFLNVRDLATGLDSTPPTALPANLLSITELAIYGNRVYVVASNGVYGYQSGASAAPGSISVSPSTLSMTKGASQAFTAVAKDANGTTLPTQPTFTWTVSGGGSISPAGLFTAGTTPGVYTLSAAASGATGVATVTVTNAPPVITTPASALPSPVTSNTTTLMVAASDPDDTTLTYTWTMTAGPAVVLFSGAANGSSAAQSVTAAFAAAGTYTFRVVVADPSNATVTSELTVSVNATLSNLTLAPAHSSVLPSAAISFTAAGLDQFGQAMPLGAVTWSLDTPQDGTLSQAGRYSAPALPGTYGLTATSGGITQHAAVVVTTASPIPTSIQVLPDTIALGASKTQTFTATLLDQLLQPYSPQPAAFTWSVNGGGSVDGRGLFTAGPAAGGPFTLSASASGLTGTAQVTVTAHSSPTVQWAAPATGSTFSAPASVSISAHAQDADGVIVRVDFYEGTLLRGSASSPDAGGLYTVAWAQPPEGSHLLFARAVNDAGLSTDTPGVTLVVNGATPVLSGMTPLFFTAGDPDSVSALVGQSLEAATRVTWNGTVLDAASWDGKQLTVTVPAAQLKAIGTFSVTVTNTGSSPSNALHAQIVAAPQAPLDQTEYTATADGSMSLGSGASGVLFTWTFSRADAGAPGLLGKAGPAGIIASSKTSSPQVSFPSLPLPAGRYTVQVVATNAAGKTSPPSQAALVILESDLNHLRVYPNPWRIGRDANRPIVFDHLVPNSTVTLFTLSGHHIKTLTAPLGQVGWDVKTEGGERVSSGLYIYLVTSPTDNKVRGKLAVIK